MNSSGTDRISDLPDSVIGQILSCLPAKDAVGTTILSKRWKNLVAFAVRLDINGYILCPHYDWSSYLFVDFVDKLLINRILSLDTLILKFSGGRGGGNDSKVISWICAALRLKVKCLTLDFNLSDLSSLFSSLYGCNTLSSLELTLPIRYRGYDEVKQRLCLPDDFNLPNLKSLKIHNVDLAAPKTTGLIDGCPVLEELCVQRCFLVTWGTLYVGTIHIRSHLLKRLDVQDCDGKLCLQLDLPNLRVLSYNNYDISVQVVSSLKFLDSAHIGSSILDATGLAKLTIACSSATRLYLTSNAIEALHRMSVDLSTYQNLTWLQLHGQSGWEILLRLLCSAPNLKKVVFEKGCTKGREGFADFECLFTKQPICLGLHVNEIHFPEFSGDDSDFELVEFFLKNAKVLMKLKLNCVSINNSCVLDRLCRLSTKPIVFITFSCWKDEELLKRSRSSLESNASLAMMNQSMSELQESKRQLMNIRHLSKSDLLESKKHLIKMNQKMIENLSTLMQQWRNST